MLPSHSNNNDGDDHDDEWGHHEEVPDDDANMNTHSAQQLRQMANAAFAGRDFDSALPLYSMAIEALMKDIEEGDDKSNKSNHELMIIFLCNRSTCLFRMELYDDAKNDAAEALRLSGNINGKAAFRLAKAYLMLKDCTSAISVLQDIISKLKNTSESDAENENMVEELTKLLQTAHAHYLASKNIPNPTSLSKLTSLKHRGKFVEMHSNYQPSIREFENIEDGELGEGNYSQVVAVRHSVTNETFALKIIEKKKVESLAKRQHPNVYNEIEMEKRVLGIRLWEDVTDTDTDSLPDGRRRIVNLYHTFQNYNHLYYLMDLHVEGGDMWSTLRYGDKMVGTYHSLAKIHLYELVEALEYIHSRGIVHRDLKAENLLLSSTGHLILIDFGTAKDLIETDLNGPEFVGTPDFMSPEAVAGTGIKNRGTTMDVDSDHTNDLWALGVVIYQLLTGVTPFNSPSQFLSFLRIQRGLLCRPMAITDDDAWDLITKLMKIEPTERFGADCFEVVKGDEGKKNRMVSKGNGYDVIKNHPYFAKCKSCPANEEKMPIPSLRDLCIRSCAQLVQNDSTNLDIDKEHPPGDGSSHDMLRLNKRDRGRVMDFLDKIRVLSQPRIYRRFFKTKQEARLGKVRQSTRDFVGLTQMNDKQYIFPMKDSENMDEERSDVIATIFPIRYMHVNNPLFHKDINDACSDDERKGYIADLKNSLRAVNRTRPKIVVASGYLDESCRKLMGKVNESIPVALNDSELFYSFWSRGGQGLVIRSSDFINSNDDADEDDTASMNCEQLAWLKCELEQCRMTKHHLFAFVDCDPKRLPSWLIQRLARGRVLCLFGLSNGEAYEKEIVHSNLDGKVVDDDSVSSVESGTEEDIHTMKIVGRSDGSLRCIQLEEYGEWEFEEIQ